MVICNPAAQKRRHWKSFRMESMALKLAFFWWISYSHSLTIDRSNQGLKVVPRNFDTSVSVLILSNNELITLNSNSFDLYVQLTELNLRSCKTTFIEDGTFDNQDKLTTLLLDRCAIMQLPRSCGPSTAALQNFQIYKGYRSGSIFRYPYFAAFNSLYRLDIGNGKDLEPFNSSILPFNTDRCRLDYSRLRTFPNFKDQSKLLIPLQQYHRSTYLPCQFSWNSVHIKMISKLFPIYPICNCYVSSN